MSAALHRLAVLRGSINPADYPPLPRMSEAELFFAYRNTGGGSTEETHDPQDQTTTDHHEQARQKD